MQNASFCVTFSYNSSKSEVKSSIWKQLCSCADGESLQRTSKKQRSVHFRSTFCGSCDLRLGTPKTNLTFRPVSPTKASRESSINGAPPWYSRLMHKW